MKKFFVAVCVCGLAAFNVSAQDVVAPVEAAVATAQEAVAPVQEAVAPEAQTVVAPVAETPVPAETGSVVEGGVVDQTHSAAPVYGAAPVEGDCGCGPAAPVYAAAPSDCGCEAVDPCCETARPRLFNRLRERFSRSNDDCCCE